MCFIMPRANNEQLIKLITRYPVLYDFAHDDYKNGRAKEQVWAEICEKLNGKADDLKKRWKNLRDTYSRYLRRLQQDPEIQRKWHWAVLMEPFKEGILRGHGTRNHSQPEYTAQKDEHLDAETVTFTFSDDDDDYNTQSQSQIPQAQSTLIATTTSPTNTRSTRKRKLTSYTEANDEYGDARETKANVFVDPAMPISYFNTNGNTESMENMDATELLFVAHARTIKTFSNRRQAITKMKIAEVIMEQELLNQEEEF